MDKLEVNDIIQITNSKHEWFGCILIVDKLKSFGAVAYCEIPEMGIAHLRVNKEDYEKVGKAHFAKEFIDG